MKRRPVKERFFGLSGARGISMVEILMTVALFTVLGAASLELLIVGSDAYSINRNRTELQQELRKSIDRIRESLRQTGTSGLVNMSTDTTYTQITFRTAIGAAAGSTTWSTDTVQYILGGTGGVRLQMISGGTTQIIASNITTLQFRRDSTTPNIINLTITASRNQGKGGTVSLNYSGKVRMRN